jgi:hypothetical protein
LGKGLSFGASQSEITSYKALGGAAKIRTFPAQLQGCRDFQKLSKQRLENVKFMTWSLIQRQHVWQPKSIDNHD